MDDHGGETTDTESMYGEIYDKIQQKKEVWRRNGGTVGPTPHMTMTNDQ